MSRSTNQGFTIVEALIALLVLMLFFVSSTMALNFFDTSAAANRNSEAARAVVDDCVNYLLDDNTLAPATATADGADLDGDGIGEGVVCSAIGPRTFNNPPPLVESRTNPPLAIVNGTLYWRVLPVGKSFGLKADADLVRVNFTLSYTFRGKTYFYKATTFKAKTV